MRTTRSLFLNLALLSALVVPAMNASPITGQANIGGNVTVFDGVIQFAPTFVSTAGAVENGSFAGLTGGTIQSLTGGPTTGAVNVPAFVTFSSGVASPVVFDLTFVSPGVGTLAGCSSSTLGSACTPTGSPFTLFQLTSNTVLASLQLNGVGYTGSSATGTTPVTSIFSTQTLGTVPQIYALLASGGAISGVTYSASFNAANVPEPYSMALMAVGLIAAGLIARGRKVSA